MKKLLILLFMLVLASFNKGYCGIMVESTGGTTVLPTQVTTPIRVTIKSPIEAQLNVKVRALDQFLVNTTDPSIKIPINKLFVMDNGGVSHQMVYNTDVKIFDYGLITGMSTLYTVKIDNVSGLAPGVYTTTLLFTTNTTSAPQSFPFTVNFIINTDQNLSCNTNPANITLSSDNVFNTTQPVDNVTPTTLYIHSNKSWKVILDTSTIGTLKADYYFQITSVSSKVTNYISAQTQLLPNQQYEIASGTATFTDPIAGSPSNEYIVIKYTLKNSSGKYISEGVYNNNVTFTLQ